MSFSNDWGPNPRDPSQSGTGPGFGPHPGGSYPPPEGYDPNTPFDTNAYYDPNAADSMYATDSMYGAWGDPEEPQPPAENGRRKLGILIAVIAGAVLGGAAVAGILWFLLANDLQARPGSDSPSDTVTSVSTPTAALPGAYGSDPELDVLYDRCADGDNTACDDLFMAAPFGSHYEEYGNNCGPRGRPSGQTWCDPDR